MKLALPAAISTRMNRLVCIRGSSTHTDNIVCLGTGANACDDGAHCSRFG